MSGEEDEGDGGDEQERTIPLSYPFHLPQPPPLSLSASSKEFNSFSSSKGRFYFSPSRVSLE